MQVKKMSFKEASVEFKEMYEKSNLHPFQSYSVMKYVFRYSAFYLLQYKVLPVIYIVYDDSGKPVLIAPAKINLVNKTCYIAGSELAFDFVDFLYCENSADLMDEAVSALFEYLKEDHIKHFCIQSLETGSVSDCALKKLYDSKKYRAEMSRDIINVKINFRDKKYDEYIGDLSKHARQNIRTAYNRLVKDGRILEYYEYTPQTSAKERKKARDRQTEIYSKRQEKRYAKGNIIRKLYVRTINFVTKGCVSDVGFISEIKIDGHTAAFLQGFVDTKNRVVLVPRLAINNEYGFYSPGMLLVCETIKRLIETDNYDALSLTRGEEKYKFDLGGTVYHTGCYNFHF